MARLALSKVAYLDHRHVGLVGLLLLLLHFLLLSLGVGEVLKLLKGVGLYGQGRLGHPLVFQGLGARSSVG